MNGLPTHLSGSQLLYIAFAIYANYQVFKWIFGAVKAIATSEFLKILAYKLTPNSVIEKRKQKRIEARKLKVIEEKRQKEKDYQEALEIHRKYEYTGWWNVGFIEEDRATLFKGYEDIKWQWGCHRIDRTKKIFSRRLKAFKFYDVPRDVDLSLAVHRA